MRRLQLLAGAGAAAFMIAVVLLIWRGPWWVDGEYLDAKGLRSGSAALVTGFRMAVVQIAAVLGAGLALLFTMFNYRLARRGQVTDRFTTALERLSSDDLYGRIGGVLALEQIIRDAPEQGLHAAQVLNAFVRQRAPHHQGRPVPRGAGTAGHRAALRRSLSTPGPRLPAEPAPDVQQALTALLYPLLATSRHQVSGAVVDLSGLHLAGACLTGENAWARRGFRFTGMYRAGLAFSDFAGSDLSRADLAYADLLGADFTRAVLARAKLTGANLMRARLAHADLIRADFAGADLRKADFTGAVLAGAQFAGADLSFADFTGVDLANVNFGDALLMGVRGVSARQLEALDIVDTDF
ncbi:pentapeptide repeat-containing protein [Streptomyces sp. NPDC050617]|uniref:pentapeptide repeat-containing protein n=1 Tax=Streptomyces sp. NPDC050617 TaxID=3154628 RepID=UPI00342AAFBF